MKITFSPYGQLAYENTKLQICNECGSLVVFEKDHVIFHKELQQLEMKIKDFMDSYQRKWKESETQFQDGS